MIHNQHKQIIEKNIEQSLSLRSTADGWKEKKKGKNMTLYTRKSPDCEVDIARLDTEVALNIEKVVQFYKSDFDSQKKGREMCQSLEVLEEIDEKTLILLFRTKSKLLVSAREVITIQHVKKLNDDEYILIRGNLGEHNSVPLTKDIVRADGKLYTLFFTKINDNLTKIQAITHMDPKGSIPVMLVNSLTDETIQHFESDISIMVK